MVSTAIEHKDQAMRKRRRESVDPTTTPKREVRADAKETKKDRKVELLLAKAELKTAKGVARKWLFALIAIGLVVYFILSSGSASGIIDKIKDFIPLVQEG